MVGEWGGNHSASEKNVATEERKVLAKYFIVKQIM